MLIKDLKAAFQPYGYLLTAAIGAAVPTIDTSYDVPLMYKYLDLVHVMCYDYHGKWDKKTGHNAPLYSRPQDTGKDVFLNVEATVKHLLKKVSRCTSTTWQFNIFKIKQPPECFKSKIWYHCFRAQFLKKLSLEYHSMVGHLN